jgi:hypothetical protein
MYKENSSSIDNNDPQKGIDGLDMTSMKAFMGKYLA